MKYLFIYISLLLSIGMVAQINEAFNYQGLLLDSKGNALDKRTANFIVTLSSDALGNQVFYQEAHTLTTNENGLFQLVIGEGSPLEGAMSNVDWLESIPYMGVVYDLADGRGAIDLGAIKFNAVPFSLYSKFVVCQDGLQGPDGPEGPQGAQGPQGRDALPAQKGEKGNSGSPGIDGLPITTMLDIEPNTAGLVNGYVYLDSGTNRTDSKPGFRYYDGSNWIDL